MRKGSRGYTLIELVIVIVLLAIVATISVRFVSLSTRGALDVSARAQRALQGTVVLEQLSREIREAYPISFRQSGNCLEFLPIFAATEYTKLPGASGSRIEIVALSQVPAASPIRTIVYGYNSSGSDLYTTDSPGPASGPVQSISNATSPPAIELQSPHRFTSTSPERRIFLVGNPVSFCSSGRFLYRYSGYGLSETQLSPPTGGLREVVSANLDGAFSLNYLPGTFQRAALVQITFTLRDYDTGSDETTMFSQEVQIRNVP